LNISGGKISTEATDSKYQAVKVYSGDEITTGHTATEGVNVTINTSITGGTFSTDPTTYKASGTYVHKNSDTEYVVNDTAHTITVSPATKTAYVGNTVALTTKADCETVDLDNLT
jgi:archaellum component FlaF (FlaF/FlaG flagellin family)